MSDFTSSFHLLVSPPCHATSSFFFPVLSFRHSRRVDELALRISPPRPASSLALILLVVFSAQFYPPSHTRAHTYTRCASPSALPSHPFHNCRFVSLSSPFHPPFSCLSVVSSLLLHDPPLALPPDPPLGQPFPLSLRMLVPFAPFPLLSPTLPKTLFSRGPFASTVIRHPFLSFSLLAPMAGRNILPFFPRSFLYLCFGPGSSLSFSLFLQLCLFPSLYLSIFSFLFFPQPALSLLLLLLLRLALLRQFFFSPLQGVFYVFPELSTRRLFSDFSLSWLPFSRDDQRSFSGKT